MIWHLSWIPFGCEIAPPGSFWLRFGFGLARSGLVLIGFDSFRFVLIRFGLVWFVLASFSARFGLVLCRFGLVVARVVSFWFVLGWSWACLGFVFGRFGLFSLCLFPLRCSWFTVDAWPLGWPPRVSRLKLRHSGR